VTDNYGTVGGGYANRAGNADTVGSNEPFATVGGGAGNVAAGRESTVAGGRENRASADTSTIAGGANNQSSGVWGAVGGGASNVASGLFGTVAGGSNNTASGQSSSVSGGFANCAGGNNSWAGGAGAYVRPGTDPANACAAGSSLGTSGDADGDEGTFVWNDGAGGSTMASTGPNRFIVRASGGVWFGTTTFPIIPSGQFIATSTGAHLTTGGTWTNASSRALKTAFESIDAGEILARVLALPLTRWQYRASPAEGVHLGPIAEDFHDAFGLGADGRAISTVDANGVALAAIQGLNAKVERAESAREAELAALRAENAKLRGEAAAIRDEGAALRARLEAIEARLGVGQ
jgi:hypothetical protein